jgi:hypothetical protein
MWRNRHAKHWTPGSADFNIKYLSLALGGFLCWFLWHGPIMAAWQAESRARTFKLYHYQNNHSFHISTLARARGQGFSSNTLLAHYLASVAEIRATYHAFIHDTRRAIGEIEG